MEKTEAILMGRSRYSETSWIVHWCAPELGLFRTLAKGAQRPRSPLAGVLDLFVTADLGFVHSKNSDLHVLTEARWRTPRLGLRSSYGRVLAATYLVKLLNLIVEPHAPIPTLYELLTKALDYLADHDPSHALIDRFERRLAEDLGLLHADTPAPLTAAQVIQDTFHRRLPTQRQQLLQWLASRTASSSAEKPHDFT